MNAVLSRVAPAVQRLSPYQPGRPVAEVARERGISDIVKLASNENPLGPGRLAREAVAGISAEHIARYPDANGGELRAALAAQLGAPAENILLGNGSNDILELAAQLVLHEGAAAVYSQHAFIVYALATAARRADARVVPARDFAHDLEGIAAAAQAENARIVFIANPNNPTGTWHDTAAVRRCLQKIPREVLVVLDEAYCEYLPDDSGALALLADFPNLLITRTFSKIHGLAGLRAGYGIGDAAVIEMLNRVRQPFNMNAVAQTAAVAALRDADHVRHSRDNNRDGLAQITAALARLHMPFIRSYGNFVAFRPPDAAALYERLLAGGVIARRLAEYDMADWLRITIGAPAENEKFLRLLCA